MGQDWCDGGRLARERELASLPCAGGDPDTDYRRAFLLDGLGRTDEARTIYLGILARFPCHADALNTFGAMLFRTGYRTAARTVFAQAVLCHPEQPRGRVNLGNVLRAAGEPDAARVEFAAALAVCPSHAQAHQGMGDLLAACGDSAGAARHWRLGYQGHEVQHWPFRGEGRPVRVLMPISVADGNLAARVFLDDRVFAVTSLAMEFFETGGEFPPHDVVLNAIGDADLCGPALMAAERLAGRISAPVINHPARVLATGRVGMAALLGSIGGVVVPRIARLPREVLLTGGGAATLARHGLGCPVLLRAPGFHTGRHFVRVAHAGDLAEAASALPGADLLAIEHVDARGVDGSWRKGRVMVLDGLLYPLHWAVSAQWKVHYFSADMDLSAAHREEEARFLADMRGFLGRKAMDGLTTVAGRLGLDYGGIDFGVLADGRVVVFEANATMAIVPPPDEPRWWYRHAAAEAALLAAQSMLIRRASKNVLF